MSQIEKFPIEETISIFIVLGCIFSPIAFFISKNAQPIIEKTPLQKQELWILFSLFVFVSVSLIFGYKSLLFFLPTALQESLTIKEIASIIFKVLVFVIIPFFVYKLLYQFNWQQFGLSSNLTSVFQKKTLVIFIIMASMFLCLQWFAGKAAAPLREGEFSEIQLFIGLPLAFIWLFIEVGLVEEFFFRALLQERLSIILKSNWWGLVIASVLFGIAHAPGMYFRGAGTVEGLGENPSFLICIGYCIAVQSIASLPFAIIWIKTRNLWLLMAIHASVDLFSNYPSLMKAFSF